MGFYVRKSVKVGPLRFNLSKSGIGVSAGVKGLRVGTGPRGNYIHMGRGGLYYRATIPSSHSRGSRSPSPAVFLPQQSADSTYDPLQEIESGDVALMADSSSAELLQELNSKRSIQQLWPYSATLGVVGFVLASSYNASGGILMLIIIVTVLVSVYLYQKDLLRKTTVLFYELEPLVEHSYQSVHDAFDKICDCGAAWHVSAKGDVRDQKYHAGATSLVQRKAMRLTKDQPPYVKTNLSVPMLPVGRQTLYFFPDRLLVFASNGVGAISYDSLHIDASPTRFVEEEKVPHDAEVVGQTWRYVNKSGGPDRRFKDNRELPIVLYEQVLLTTSSGLNELVQLSRVGIGPGFHQAIATLASCCKQ